MASDYDRFVSKKVLYGDSNSSVIECGDIMSGDSEAKDTNFTKTVEGLSQSFILVPQQVKEAYLIHILKTFKLKKNQ